MLTTPVTPTATPLATPWIEPVIATGASVVKVDHLIISGIVGFVLTKKSPVPVMVPLIGSVEAVMP